MKKISLLLLVLFLGILVGCESNGDVDSLTAIKERGYIVLGLDDTFAPLGYRDENGDVVGFDIDLAKAVATELGVELRIQPIDWDSKVLELNAGNIDMIWNGLTITEERKENILFSEPYLNNRQVVLTRTGEEITAIDGLTGLSIGVQLDSSGESALEASDVYQNIEEKVQFSTFTEALLDLQSGRIDAIVIDEVMARYIVSNGTYSVTVTDVSLGYEAYGIGFRLADSTLRDEIDRILTDLEESGETEIISNDWFDEDLFRK